ncbi:hypothetical protein HK57_00394 [Aspergillus ustus]|uniref:Cupin 2 conserved barrel domain-containing protein n=1 Tax=Aspergillus ustus TaxID=40382 RepID=A0A0C1C3Y6_ASPUT|nr:hypothetical protein HK57_00394 [Aspergillus ustus]
MARPWQLWLSRRPLRRTGVPWQQAGSLLSAHGAALFEFLRDNDGRWVVRETHYINNEIVRRGESGPPLHIHWLQNEYFQVEQGVLGLVRNEQVIAATKDDGVIEIPAGTRHRFWAHAQTADKNEDLVFRVWAEPQYPGTFDENFLRNFVGYQRDCQQAGLRPSVCQLILFSYHSATLGTPPFWMPLWVLKMVHYVLAYWVAERLLGYKAEYPEYTNPVAR